MVIDVSELTNIGLVVHAYEKLGTNYVYGMKGTVMTQANYTYLYNTYTKYVPVSDEKKVGTVCVDCSGLISWYTSVIKSSAAFKSESTAYSITTIANAPVGAAVWRSGHIGIYVGDGYAIEARGSAFGTVKTKVSDRDWTHWFLIKDITYVEVEEEEYVVESTTILINGKEYEVEAVMIENYNYIKLRDLGQSPDIEIGWDKDTKLASLDTK